MGKKDKAGGRFELDRRDFLKVAGAGAAAAGAGTGWALYPAAAAGYPAGSTVKYTTCPYCSAQCGQTVVVAADGTTVLDIHGMSESPVNNGGLCAKGAGGFQLATNERRLGVPEHTAGVDGFDFTGRAWKRQGDGAWQEISAQAALNDAAQMLVAARNSDTQWQSKTPTGSARGFYNSRGVQFFGSSHANNEVNNLYRKLIANFGTSNTEHQARI